MNLVPKPLEIELTGNDVNINRLEESAAIDTTLENEEYILVVGNSISIRAGSERAVFYARQTLEQIKNNDSIKSVRIHDKPRFEYRSLMIDCARHMFSIEEIKKIIDAMALLKFNKLHWHLTDDQGWRIESERFPQLNTDKAQRKYSNFGKTVDNKPYGRVYTKEELKEIVAYCRERYIDVIPEMDSPGHTSALLGAMSELTCDGEAVEVKTRQGIYKDVICPANEKGYEVITALFDELCEIFPYEYYHIGGDETPSAHWQSCPACQSKMAELGITDYAQYHNAYMNRIIDYLSSKGKKCVLWNDVAKGDNLDKRAILQYWKERDKASISFVNAGGKMVLSPFTYYYMDYDYDITSMKHTFSFNPDLKGLTADGLKNILGVEVPVWTEYIEDNDRLEKMLFPRVLAVADTAWGGNIASYNELLDSITVPLNMISKMGISYMPQNRWSYSRLAMPKGWLKFVFDHYTIDYIKSAMK